MPNEDDSTRPEFWDKRYRANRMPWDLGRIPAALGVYLAASPATGRVLIPGCGSGYEVRAFAEAGWQVCAIDFSLAAVERARCVLGNLASCVALGDFFEHPFEAGSFDLVYERTFLCSLPPERWQAYAARVEDLLAPAGRLVGIFFYGQNDEPPPYPMTPASANALFAGFQLIEDEPLPASLPAFVDSERWQVWQKLRPDEHRTSTI